MNDPCIICTVNEATYKKEKNPDHAGWCRQCHKRYLYLKKRLQLAKAFAPVDGKLLGIFKSMMKVSGRDERRKVK